jgi:hypothetical protein
LGGGASAQAGPLELRLSLDRMAYEPSAVITFTVTLRNTTQSPLTLVFPTSQRYDVVITSATAEVARWSAGRVFAQTLDQIILAGGAMMTFTDQWAPTTEIGPFTFGVVPSQPLAPGVYGIRADLPIVGTRPPATVNPLLIVRPLMLEIGCTATTNHFPGLNPPVALLQWIEPAGIVESIWRWDPRLERFSGYSALPGAPRDLTMVGQGDALTICVLGPGKFFTPGP